MFQLVKDPSTHHSYKSLEYEMLSDLRLSEMSFKQKDGKDVISGIKKCHRMAIQSYEIDSKELIRFTNLKQADGSFSHFY